MATRRMQATGPSGLRRELEDTIEGGDKLRVPASNLMNIFQGSSSAAARSLLMFLKSKRRSIVIVGSGASSLEDVAEAAGM